MLIVLKPAHTIAAIIAIIPTVRAVAQAVPLAYLSAIVASIIATTGEINAMANAAAATIKQILAFRACAGSSGLYFGFSEFFCI